MHVNYGYPLPEIIPDQSGTVKITRHMIIDARDEDGWNRGDFSLKRFIDIKILSKSGMIIKSLKVDLEERKDAINLRVDF